MTQEDNGLLLKDLCGRFLYGVKVLYEGQVKEIQYIEPLYNEIKLLDSSNYTIGIEDIKPYLRPMTSMTEEEREEYQNIIIQHSANLESWHEVDFLNKHHLDYRGLIEKNLALDCTGLHIYD